jgi:hypothetical protein
LAGGLRRILHRCLDSRRRFVFVGKQEKASNDPLPQWGDASPKLNLENAMNIRRAHAALAICVSLAACGGGGGGGGGASAGGGGGGGGASPTTTDRGRVLRIYEAPSILARLASAAIGQTTIDYKTWTDGPCVFGDGSLRTSLDGVPLANRSVLPTGNHTLMATFSQCLVDGLVGSTLDGTATASYSSADLSSLSASVAANSLSATVFAFNSDLFSVTADGSGSWIRTRTASSDTTTFAPSAGSRLADNRSAWTATFGGGSYSQVAYVPPAGLSAVLRDVFDNVLVTIDGRAYLLTGDLQFLYRFDSSASHVGEVRITSDGTLVARLYGDSAGVLRIEVLGPLPHSPS